MGTVGKKANKGRGTAWAYAIELGITYNRLNKLGGEMRLRAMSEDARILMLKNGQPGNSQIYRKGGILARGYKPRVPGVVSQRVA